MPPTDWDPRRCAQIVIYGTTAVLLVFEMIRAGHVMGLLLWR